MPNPLTLWLESHVRELHCIMHPRNRTICSKISIRHFHLFSKYIFVIAFGALSLDSWALPNGLTHDLVVVRPILSFMFSW